MQLSILVVLYNSSCQQSETLQSILQADLTQIDLKLIIWNNGPHLLDNTQLANYLTQASDKGIAVNTYQDIRNLSLSKIYNFILQQQDADFFIPLDQDTQLTKDFFNTIAQHRDLDLILPIVYAEGQDNLVKFPFNTKTKQPILEQQQVDARTITSVTSAMAISKRLVDLFKQHKLTVFDESFAFYGVDTAFFYNIHQIAKQHTLSCGCFGRIEHSLSTYVQENKQASYRRSIEFLYYAILYRLNYKNKSRFSMLFFLLPRLLKGRIKDLTSLKNVLYCITYKKHPRASLTIDLNQ
ncbi:glycosyltransferase family 2 protein [Entomomonas asaccharolytica]|uniref:Uncharacterized protein n=1 Tax=Entomomonas asaccharolytica TaxID=2785331 RepID=A0A974NDR2_9GAMM|nr:hypothetical protein [Entomomonas asaccharolytica]QQP84689.1 hypothetical protein JHT90_09735 [Entomomonas asaccharolytica]